MKRFSETDKWTKDNWFSELDPKYKLFWLYIIDNCDNVGVWEVNKKMANFLIGYEYSMEDVLGEFGDKIHVFCEGRKWWIRKFVDFQHGVLNEESQSKPIISYITLLRNHSLYKEYTNGIHTVQGKGKGKGKGTGKGTEKTGDEYSLDFEVFWKQYPKKKAKMDAYKAWNQMEDKRPEIDTIIKSIDAQKKDEEWTKDKGKYIPYPATWLRSASWDNEMFNAEILGSAGGSIMTPEFKRKYNL